MKKILLVLGLVFLLSAPGFTEDVDDLAVSVALNFATLIDDGNFQAAYWSGSPLLQQVNAEQEWLDKSSRAQRVLGKVLQRELKNIRSVSSPPDLPDDDYRIILFHTRTERKTKAAEVLLVHQANGFWQVCAYSIR